jgi:type VI secretion system protein VasI
MSRAVVISAGLLLCAHSIVAQTMEVVRPELARCAELGATTARLDCYDQVVSALGILVAQPISADGGEGAWQVSETSNPLDDSRTVTFALRAESGESRFGQPVFLALRCQSGELDAFIIWGDYLGNDDPRVTSRIGEAQAQTETWSSSADNTGAFRRGDVATFIAAMSASNQFVAQVTPYNENPVTAVFNTTGLDRLLPSLWEACPRR